MLLKPLQYSFIFKISLKLTVPTAPPPPTHTHTPKGIKTQASIYPGPGLPLASILRRSLGLSATTFRGSLASFKGSSLVWNSSCTEIFCFVCDVICPFYNSVLGSVLSDNITYICTFSGMLVHYSSNRFIQRPVLVVLHASITLVVGSPPSSVYVFY